MPAIRTAAKETRAPAATLSGPGWGILSAIGGLRESLPLPDEQERRRAVGQQRVCSVFTTDVPVNVFYHVIA